MQWLETLQSVTGILVTLLGICYFYQILYLFIPVLARKKKHQQPEKQNRYAILVCARNEEAVIGNLLDSIRSQDYPGSITPFVMADNCTDNTARVAREHGATVFTRFNQKQVGKGYTLAELLRRIGDLSQFDAFLIFDADNVLKKDYVRQMNQVVSQGYPAFCGYRNTKNFGSNWLTRCYGVWYLHESVHLNRSRMALGTSCIVSGTGFGFTRELIEQLGGWHYFTLTEDIEFSTWCATQGIVIGYCHDAICYDEQPTSFRQSWRQRTRWTQGGIQIAFKYPVELLRGLFQGGRTTYASFEAITLSMWGYGVSAICSGTALLTTFLSERWLGLAESLVFAAAGTYCSLLLIGAWTVITEWSRIRATRREKVLSIFQFPLFLISYLPIAVTAMFRKFQWAPIHHTAVRTVQELEP